MTIATIKARVAKASPGGWHRLPPPPVDDHRVGLVLRNDGLAVPVAYTASVAFDQRYADATFIAAARTDVELLLAVAEAAERTVRRLYRENGGYGPTRDDLMAARADLEEALAALEAGA